MRLGVDSRTLVAAGDSEEPYSLPPWADKQVLMTHTDE